MSVQRVPTPGGEARVTTIRPVGPIRGTLVLGHGAGGRRWTEDVTAVAQRAVALGWCVALVEQPWRVAGRRVGPGPPALDAAWLAVLGTVERIGPLVVGGRSAGARVACRTAAQVGGDAVLALSFPLHPPSRPQRSRAAELALPVAHGIALHVIQGAADPHGTPAEVAEVLAGSARLTTVPGTHSLEAHAAGVADAAAVTLAAIAGGGHGGLVAE